MDISQTIRQACDNGFGIVASIGLSPYQVFLTKITNDKINYNDPINTRVRTDTPIFVGSGIDSNLYPHISYITKMDGNQNIISSQNALTDMELYVGPIPFPYSINSISGGYDPMLFQPDPNTARNIQTYLHIFGIGLNQSKGNYFRIHEVVLNGMDNIFYYLRVKSISEVIL